MVSIICLYGRSARPDKTALDDRKEIERKTKKDRKKKKRGRPAPFLFTSSKVQGGIVFYKQRLAFLKPTNPATNPTNPATKPTNPAAKANKSGQFPTLKNNMKLSHIVVDSRGLHMARTIDVIRDREGDETRLTKPGELAEGRFRDLRNPPSLQALKLHAALFRHAGGAVVEDRWFTISLADLRAIPGLQNHDRNSLADIVAELRGVTMEWNDTRPNGRRYTTFAGLLEIAEVDFDGDQGDGPVVLRWKFGEGLRRIVDQSEYWAVIDRQTAFQMGSRYSLRLFEVLSVRENMDRRTSENFTVMDLRGRLGVPEGKLKTWDEFNRRVIKPAVEEINQLARFNVIATPKKRGRQIVAVELAWSPKPSLAATKAELGRARLGRKARRDGTVEAMVEVEALPLTFPAEGGIRYVEPWGPLAKKHGNGRDVDQIASAFREWWTSKGRSLSAKDVEAGFTSFCKKQPSAL